MRRSILAALAAALALPAGAGAAPPMPLSDVQPGARCAGLSVVRGTAISAFDVEVLDVIDRARPDTARILVRVSGPAVDATGLGPGFSGSPVLCRAADGGLRTAGAIAETIGEFGGRTALATPIEAMLAQPVQPPAGTGTAARPSTVAARSSRRAAFPAARSLAGPLTLGGVGARTAALLTRAARKAGRTLVTSPARTRAGLGPPQQLVPGSAVSIGLASGDITLGAIGTVTYVDGGDVYAFGHPFEGAGRRSLFLQDAFIHTVVNNPLGAPELATYKLGSAGNDVGTVTGDGLAAVTGRLGALPRSFPVRVTAADLDTGRRRGTLAHIADEGDAGQPAGGSALGLVAGAAVAESAATVLGGAPAQQTAEMCLAVSLRELRRPMRVCNTYVVTGPAPGAIAGPLVGDVGEAARILDTYRFGTLHPTNVEVGLRLRRGARQAFLVGASAPERVRRGRAFPVRLRLRRTRTGAVSTRTIRVRVPRDAPRGERTLRILGTPADQGSEPAEDGGEELVLLFEEEPDEAGEAGPDSVAEVRRQFLALDRFDGLRVSFGGGRPARRAYRDPALRISGRAEVPITIRR